MWELQHQPFLTRSTRQQATGSWGSGGGEGLGHEEHGCDVTGIGLSFGLFSERCFVKEPREG
jgi:hypothetical protein